MRSHIVVCKSLKLNKCYEILKIKPDVTKSEKKTKIYYEIFEIKQNIKKNIKQILLGSKIYLNLAKWFNFFNLQY